MNQMPSPNRRALIVCAGAAGIAAGFANDAQAAELDATLDAYLAPYVAAHDYAGAIQIMRRGRVLARRTYGFADGAHPVRINSRFAIQSISKLITEGTIYRLEDAGALHLADPIARWMPDFPRADAVTVQMLLDHRSGLARDLSNYEQEARRPRTTAELMQWVARDGYIAEPGTQENYSNNGYRVLASVIEHASGSTYHETAARLVTRPLGMHDTGSMFGARPIANLAQGHTVGDDPGTLRAPLQVEFSNEQGAASFYSTVGDLTRLAAHYPFRPEPAAATQGRRKRGHNGFGNGYMSDAYHFPETETVVTMLGNIESGLLTYLQADLERMAFGEATQPPPLYAEAPVPVETLAPYVGRYGIGPGRSMEVARVGDRLGVNAGGGFTALWGIGGGRFFSRIRYATLSFVVENGAVTRIDWTEQGRTFPCPRLAA